MMSNQFSCMTPERCKLNPVTGICMGCGHKFAQAEEAKTDASSEHLLSEKSHPLPDVTPRFSVHPDDLPDPQKP